MGSIMSAINDDIDEFDYLLTQAKTKRYDVYSKEAVFLRNGYETGLRGVILEKYIAKEMQKAALHKEIQLLDKNFEEMLQRFNQFN